ncbi:MAG: hypothetical protein F9K29_17560 [Hyphomicrobiaceae bacterium]|nr:MAG: hypothetical protein F9K29_17560 [Hyphomicrobiaceae bacterium]
MIDVRYARRAMRGIVAASCCAASVAVAETVDPHRLYEQRCASCHAPHASDLAREMLELKDGKLIAKKSGKDLPSVLGSHRGTRQSQPEIEALIEAFRRNISSGSLYQRKCIDCHDRARDFARTRLVIDQSVLRGRYSGRVVEDFLRGHGRLAEPEVTDMVATLKWQLETREP